ncbi:exported protein of unknown function [Ruminococcaceae bacterium BL-6]|nr:exported protein of unknown function [Ruminococcaceae bacterium BL-6]
MKTRIRLLCCAMTLLIATAAAACADGQTSSGGNASSGSDAQGNRDSQTSYIGKVTSVTGNQVELALGTVNGKKSGETSSGADGFKGEPPESGAGGGFPDGSRPAREGGWNRGGAASGVSSARSGGGRQAFSASSFTLTGETKTILVPVGLTLSGSGMGGGAQASPAASGAPGGNAPGGSTAARGQSASGAQKSKTSSSARTGTAQTQRKSDFSSITKGMILEVTEEARKDGSSQIVKVAVLSK